MELFIDTGAVSEVEEIAAWGVLSGATTNPSLLAKEDGEPGDIIRKIADLVNGPTSAEVVSPDAEGMIADANRLFGVLDSYSDVLSGVKNQESYSQALSQLESKLAEMKNLSHISRLDNNLWRQQKLLANQQNRPARPSGWQVPSPLVQS